MDELKENQNIISQDKAKELADAFLKEKYYDFDKVIFQASEQVQSSELLIYRFSGLIIDKVHSMIEQLARDKSKVTFKFVIDISSKNGRVLNYFLT
jgi:hypothetical protein